MYRLSASLLFLLAGTIALAQTSGNSVLAPRSSPTSASPGKTGESVVFYENRPDNLGCPVGFSASRQADLQTMLANDRSQAGPAQGLHLTLARLNTPTIQSVEVTVYATSPKLRALPVDALSSDTISKTFELQRKAGSNSLTDADVWMHNVGSVSSVDLISITYTDGSTWHATESLRCRAVPSNFLLVGSK